MKRVIELRKKERENLLEKAEDYLKKLKKILGPLSPNPKARSFVIPVGSRY
jgi:hypothetical protein